jgi:hypothetical protein
MNITLTSYSNPNYFVPAGSFKKSVDYRVGLVHQLSQAVQRALENLTDSSAATFAHLFTQMDVSLSTRVNAYEAQFDTIERLCAAPANWADSPAVAPDADQVNAAQRGLFMLLLENIPAPNVMLHNDGTLGAYWRHGDTYASIDFDADGDYPWSAAVGLDVVSGIWSDGPIPKELRDIAGA